MNGTEQAATYRTLVRRQYDLAKTLQTERDLDARLAIFAEQRAVAAACQASTVPATEREVISSEEFSRAYPTLRLNARRTAPDRGRWSRRQAALS
jgi:hypothetical protein